jgi:hypothetical protein
VRHPGVALAAAVTGIAALFAAGYAALGPTGLIDAASVTAIGVLFVARGLVRADKPRRTPQRTLLARRTPAVSADDFPAYRKLTSDLEWARMSQRHYEHIVRPMLARLAVALGQPQAELKGPPDITGVDGPGVDRATLERIIASLEAAKGAPRP